jgi:hypothetical protein
MTLGELISKGGQGALDRFADVGSLIRYGVPFNQKEAIALRGETPGYRAQNMATEIGPEIEQRRTAAYLFGKQWPHLAPEWQPIIDRMRGGDDPRILAVTQDAVERGAMDALGARPMYPRPQPSGRR